ncbi:hypothetical protein LCS82_09690 [Vibrio harveyi]|uniref:HAD domain-containing protein n=1 Tax=Vibrio harveyi TaxID=669 RepID=UPI003BB753EC
MVTSSFPLIFLDIDGVLNSKQHQEYRRSCAGKEKRRQIFATHSDTRIALGLVLLDYTKVALLRDLIEVTGSRIVISSTYREGVQPAYFETLFRLAGHPLPRGTVIGFTPILDEVQYQKRGHEIDFWLNKTGYSGRYVIIDDDNEKLFLPEQNLYHVDNRIGLTKVDCQNIKMLLTDDKYWNES